ncbi:MAG: nuclear transport factor 2 family protein [Acidimicrobiaceae bacterium]|nr:nuclear transport factor 2 family protein [Acidimicrobiaceae bacterium]
MSREEAAMAGDTDSDHAAGAASAESVVRAYWERVWLEQDLDALEDLVTEPVVRHTAEGTQSLTRHQYRRRLADAFEAVRATEVSIDSVTADGLTVWIRLTLRGVSLATAAPMSLAWLGQYRIEGGRIAELWALHQPGTDWSAR